MGPQDSKAEDPPVAFGLGGLAALPPGYFGMVMATGIVSLAAQGHGLETAAKGLFWLNFAAYLTLWILTLLRLACHRAQFIDDLTCPSRSAAFLTKPAATCVLGCQFAVLTAWMPVARGLWFLGVCLWVALNYTFFAAVTVREDKAPLEAGISGSWLLAVVAAESVSVLGTLVAPASESVNGILFLSLATYLVGAALYVLLGTLILYRWLFFRMRPASLTPDY